MDRELFSLVEDDLNGRTRWANKLAGFYTLRRTGHRRTNKPWPLAADLHSPIIDTDIDKMKPFYMNQFFQVDRFVDMVGEDPNNSEYYTACAWWFDYKLKQCSNFEDVLPIVIDYMMLYAHGIMQTTWDNRGKRLRFVAINPLYLIVPTECGDLCDADRVCHVKHLTKWEYMHGINSSKYNQDGDFIKKVTGSPDTDRTDTTLSNTKARIEGINHSTDPNCIILWEIYEKDADGNFIVHTVSPKLPEEDVREAIKLPYKNGTGDYGDTELPFVDFQFERNDEDYYDARGVAEILMPFQMSCKRMWDEKHDCMTMYNRPMLTTDRDYPSITNISTKPGQILPGNLRAIQMGAPPISYDQEMANCRLVAEQRIAIPDFGVGGQPFKQTSDRKTATEVQALGTYTQEITNMRGRLFRRSGNKVFCQAWGLLKQYDRDLSFVKDMKVQNLDYDKREEVIMVKPNASSDSWNLHARLQRAVSRMQMFRGDPNIRQGELSKSCLELDEPGLVSRLYEDAQDKQHDEAEKEMLEVPAMDTGFPVTPDPADDDAARLPVLFTYVVRNIQIGKKPIDPAGPIMIAKHIEAHLQQLAQKNPKAGNALRKQWQQIQKALSQQQGIDQGQQGAPSPQGPVPQQAPVAGATNGEQQY
jgi:hypothetical protein